MNTRTKDAGTGSYEIKTKHKSTVGQIKHLKKNLPTPWGSYGFKCSVV